MDIATEVDDLWESAHTDRDVLNEGLDTMQKTIANLAQSLTADVSCTINEHIGHATDSMSQALAQMIGERIAHLVGEVREASAAASTAGLRTQELGDSVSNIRLGQVEMKHTLGRICAMFEEPQIVVFPKYRAQSGSLPVAPPQPPPAMAGDWTPLLRYGPQPVQRNATLGPSTQRIIEQDIAPHQAPQAMWLSTGRSSVPIPHKDYHDVPHPPSPPRSAQRLAVRDTTPHQVPPAVWSATGRPAVVPLPHEDYHEVPRRPSPPRPAATMVASHQPPAPLRSRPLQAQRPSQRVEHAPVSSRNTPALARPT